MFRIDDLNNSAHGKGKRHTVHHFTATERQLQFITTHTIQLYSTTIETQLALETSASTDITWTTHLNYIDNRFTFEQTDDDINYGYDV